MTWEEENGKEYRNEYKKINYDRIALNVPKGKKAEYMQLAAEQGQSLNSVINRLLSEWYQMEREDKNNASNNN